MFERDKKGEEKVDSMRAALAAYRRVRWFWMLPWVYRTARQLHKSLAAACREVSAWIEHGGPSQGHREWMTTELCRAELWIDANWDWHDRFGEWPKLNQNKANRASRRRIRKWLKGRH